MRSAIIVLFVASTFYAVITNRVAFPLVIIVRQSVLFVFSLNEQLKLRREVWYIRSHTSSRAHVRARQRPDVIFSKGAFIEI